MKTFFVALVVLAQLSFCIHYAYRTWRRENQPTLSMWVLFLLGVGLSFATYVIEKRYDLASGILNTVDVMAVAFILIAVALWGKRTVHLERFDRFYLAGVASIVVYAIVSGDIWRSNLFCQLLIVSGYIPTFRKMHRLKMNTESFGSWAFSLTASACAVYPAAVDGNDLSLVYALRSVASVAIILLVMLYYEFRS